MDAQLWILSGEEIETLRRNWHRIPLRKRQELIAGHPELMGFAAIISAAIAGIGAGIKGIVGAVKKKKAKKKAKANAAAALKIQKEQEVIAAQQAAVRVITDKNIQKRNMIIIGAVSVGALIMLKPKKQATPVYYPPKP